MSDPSPDEIRVRLDTVYRAESGRIFATLIRLLGSFERAEEAMQEAFNAAVQRWPADGIPANPRAWLISTARFKAIDTIRRRVRFEGAKDHIVDALYAGGAPADPVESVNEELPDDQLRLIFTCCHPALPPEARTALTLREVCGLTTEEIARAFLAPVPTIAQRIVRAKARIRDECIPYQVPSAVELPERLGTVLAVIYLLFNEGYAATSGETLTRADLSAEAIRLARLLVELMPETETVGLLALMLLHDSRREARIDDKGAIVLLDRQDRSAWNQGQIREGLALVERAASSRQFGPYTLQAAIAAVHARASDAKATDWVEILAHYDALLAIHPSPVVELNRAAAVAMHKGPAAGLDLIDALLARGELQTHHLAHSARANLLRQLGRDNEARAAYVQARAFAKAGPEIRYLDEQLKELA